MGKIGIIMCGRYQGCAGGKCFRAIRERVGAFSAYPDEQPIEVVGYSSCGGCPGGNIEHVPGEMKSNGAEVIHLATGLIVGYPPCAHVLDFKSFIETAYEIPVIVGTHPIPLKYFNMHQELPFWKQGRMDEVAGDLMREDRDIMQAYD